MRSNYLKCQCFQPDQSRSRLGGNGVPATIGHANSLVHSSDRETFRVGVAVSLNCNFALLAQNGVHNRVKFCPIPSFLLESVR